MIASNAVNVVKISKDDLQEAVKDWLNKELFPNAQIDVIALTTHRSGSRFAVSAWARKRIRE